MRAADLCKQKVPSLIKHSLKITEPACLPQHTCTVICNHGEKTGGQNKLLCNQMIRPDKV